jgi:hyaluronoglucosaminidase
MSEQMPLGVVEGFYGPPWSHGARLDMIKFLGKNGFNVYIYAPKDDPYHREKWAEPYPKSLFAKLAQLVETSKRSGVNFCFAVSPGLSMRYSSDSDFQKLSAKFSEVAKLGVEWFGLFLDDIPDELQHDEDKAAFSSLGEAHAHLGNELEKKLREIVGDRARLILCPTQYIGVQPTDYHRALGEKLSQSVHVMWTGKYVCTPSVTAEDADSFGVGIRRRPFLWDNYPVNDYAQQLKIFLGPVRRRSPDLLEHLSGFVSNPMNQAEASKFALVTYREYFKDPVRYDPDKAWERAVKELLPKAMWKPFLSLSEHSRGSFLDFRESERLGQLLESVKHNPRDQNSTKALSDYLILQRRAISQVERQLKGPLRTELMPMTRKISDLLEVGIASIDLIRRTRKGVTKADRRKAKTIEAKLRKAEGSKYQVLGEVRLTLTDPERESMDRDNYISTLVKLAVSLTEGK